MTIDQLRQIPLLSDMDNAALEVCLAEKQLFVRHYAKGTTVHHQNDTCTALDVVLAGNMVAYALSENGSAITMFEFKETQIIGANLLFGDHHIYPLNVYSVTACDVLHITKPAVTNFLHNYFFVMQYVKSLSHNSQGMNRKITMLTQKTLRENILDYLRHQAALQSSSKIVLPISKKELADYMGVQRPSLFRELKKLKDEGLIDIDNHLIKLMFT